MSKVLARLLCSCARCGLWLGFTLEPVTDVVVPHFDRLLNLVARCCRMTGLGYVGVDLVIDRHKGPLMLELNARPGLAIQIANRAGLGARLSKVDAEAAHALALEDRVSFAQANFGSRRSRQL
jgi:hypothetical protein